MDILSIAGIRIFIALSGILHDDMDTPSGIATPGLFALSLRQVIQHAAMSLHPGIRLSVIRKCINLPVATNYPEIKMTGAF